MSNGSVQHAMEKNTENNISLKDFFAGLAMQGLLADNHWENATTLAREAYIIANNMLKARGES